MLKLALLGILSGLASFQVQAHWENVAQLWPPDMPQSTKDWFSRQKSPNGNACCSVADGVPVDWDLKDNHYRVLDYVSSDQPRWREVPKDVVIKGETNPTGRAVVWFMPGRDVEGLRGIRCFIPGHEI